MATVNTNVGAMVALRNLSMVGTALEATQKKISTGYKVADAYDDGASWAVAQSLRGQMNAITAVNERLAVGKGMVDVAVKAGENISSSMLQVQTVLTKLADGSMTGSDRTNYENQYNTLKNDILNFIQDAVYNSVTLINTSSNQSIISNVSGSNITVTAQNLMSVVYNSLTNVTGSYSSAATMIASSGGYSTALTNLGLAMNQLASDARRISNQINFNNAISDATNAGLGNIVDADLAKESANLQAMQVKQQLSTQALSLANQSPQSLLSLFR